MYHLPGSGSTGLSARWFPGLALSRTRNAEGSFARRFPFDGGFEARTEKSVGASVFLALGEADNIVAPRIVTLRLIA